jgi:hypothetical protein
VSSAPSPSPSAAGRRAESVSASRESAAGFAARARRLASGGTDGNEQLTTATGAILLVLLAVLGVTILRVRQLTWLHLFLGLLLIGPVALKMASTGYRFMRYYTHDPEYRRNGAPELLLRVIAPGVILATVVVFISGVILLFNGPQHRGPWVSIHKASFIVWIGLTALHVLGHLPGMPGPLRAMTRMPQSPLGDAGRAGRAGRGIALASALVAGLVLAIVLIPDFGVWTHHFAFRDHG